MHCTAELGSQRHPEAVVGEGTKSVTTSVKEKEQEQMHTLWTNGLFQ